MGVGQHGASVVQVVACRAEQRKRMDGSLGSGARVAGLWWEKGGVSAGSVLELLVIGGKGGGETSWGASWFEVPGMGQRMERYTEKEEGGRGRRKIQQARHER